MAYDPSTDEGKVRLLCSDTDDADRIFSDAEITAFLSLNGGGVLMAAAQAIDAMAVNEVMVLKVIKLLDVTTNGAAVAKALNAKADALRKQVNEEVAIDWAEMNLDVFTRREIIWKDAIRDS